MLGSRWLFSLLWSKVNTRVLNKRMMTELEPVDDISKILSHPSMRQGTVIGVPVEVVSPWYQDSTGSFWRPQHVDFRHNPYPIRPHSTTFNIFYPPKGVIVAKGRSASNVNGPLTNVATDTNVVQEVPCVSGCLINDPQGLGLPIEETFLHKHGFYPPDGYIALGVPAAHLHINTQPPSDPVSLNPLANPAKEHPPSTLAPYLEKFIQEGPDKVITRFGLHIHQQLSNLGEKKLKDWFKFSVFLDAWWSRQSEVIQELPVFTILRPARNKDSVLIPDVGHWSASNLAPLLVRESVGWRFVNAGNYRKRIINSAQIIQDSPPVRKGEWKYHTRLYRTGVYAWFLSHKIRFENDKPWDDDRLEKIMDFMRWAGSSSEEAHGVYMGIFGVMMNHSKFSQKVLHSFRKEVKEKFGDKHSMLELEPSLTVGYMMALYAANSWDYLLMEQEAMLGLQKILFGTLKSTTNHITPSNPDDITKALSLRAKDRPERRKAFAYYLRSEKHFTVEDYDLDLQERWHPDFEDRLASLVKITGEQVLSPEFLKKMANNPPKPKDQPVRSILFSENFLSKRGKVDYFRALQYRLERIGDAQKINLKTLDLKTWGLSSDRLEALVDHVLNWSQTRSYNNMRPVVPLMDLESLLIKTPVLKDKVSPNDEGKLSPIDGLDHQGKQGIFSIMREVVNSEIGSRIENKEHRN